MADSFLLSCSAVADAIIFFTFFDVFLKWRQGNSRFFYGVGVFLLSILIILSNRILLTSFNNAVVMILFAVLFACLLYYGNICKKVFLGILSGTLIGSIEIAVLFLIGVVFSVSAEDIMQIQEY